ncbi:hypothetical protein G7Y89_g7442 [Cudoniella acicularis]|uniref:Carboxylic ester hydrolase n=1 Tax=Cudoniella acicularis TaxID=354080 RepID=A0A8H4W3T5_9HELO|nr:hypothetical protein G7Y89_g7442 [Cudoniella acicularis]
MVAAILGGSVSAGACSSTMIPYPSLDRANFISLEANLIANYSQAIPIGLYTNHGAVNVTNTSFCNVTLSYSHTGHNDTTYVQVWLPIDNWNGRIQAMGGAGYQAGANLLTIYGMTAAIGEGYSAVSTDAGLGDQVTPINWALLPDGNVNLNLLEDLASISLNDAAVIGKSITSSFYGKPPKYSYWSGCSQGGRQGLMLAQRYPDAFDGIAASSPAINWNQFLMGDFWPSFLMDRMRVYPPSCEIDAITAAAIATCDGKDGILDGVITDEVACDFDSLSLVGTVINCTNFGTSIQISEDAAKLVQEVWSGAKRSDGSFLWFGLSKDAPLAGPSVTDLIVLPTTCSSNGTCKRGSFEISEDWIKLFVLKNSSADLTTITHEQFDSIALSAIKEYDSIIGTNNPDLSVFKAKGGKMISYHGLSDQAIPPRGSMHYYDAVAALDPSVHDFYRLFPAPGLLHCFGGSGAYPDGTFDALRKWVEEGVAPDALNATSVDTTPIINRKLCPYPKKQTLVGKAGTNYSAAAVDFNDFICV